MAALKWFLTVSLTTWLLAVCVGGKDCVSQDGCTCQFDDGSGSIDLTSLSNTDGTPRFKDVPYGNGQAGLMSYNPCGGFSESPCSDAAVCLHSGGIAGNIGDAKSAQLKYDEDSGHLYAGYTSQDTAVTKNTQVKLICDESACDATFKPTDGDTSDVIVQYFAHLTTVCACPNMCSASGPTNCGGKQSGSGGLSVGTIILIGVLCVIVLYMVLGTVYMKVGKKATGSDLIPNKAVWAGGFSLIGTGFKFVLSKCFPGKFSVHKDLQ